jgi:hypothetical protein
MHSLNQAALGHAVAASRTERPVRALAAQRPDRPPGPRARARAAYSAGRLARRLDREMARRAVA